MILYHGSNVIIENIDLTRSKPNKDFGKGFYNDIGTMVKYHEIG